MWRGKAKVSLSLNDQELQQHFVPSEPSKTPSPCWDESLQKYALRLKQSDPQDDSEVNDSRRSVHQIRNTRHEISKSVSFCFSVLRALPNQYIFAVLSTKLKLSFGFRFSRLISSTSRVTNLPLEFHSLLVCDACAHIFCH